MSDETTDRSRARSDLAERILRACIDAALEAHEDAGIAGLCAEGRWEVAVSAMRSLDLRTIVTGEEPTAAVDSPPPSRE